MNEVKERVKEMNSAMDAAEFTSTETRREIPFAIEVSKEQVQHKSKRGYLAVKRCLDVVLSFIALILLSPVFLVIAILIKLEDKGPAIYKHKRVGKNGKDLFLYKFRSMQANPAPLEELLTPEQLAEYKVNFKLENDPRITKIGKFLRKSSLDELPQLVNILKGELSIVGPRPVVEEECQRYGEKREKFLSVAPGLTGYWQSNGRSAVTYEDRMNMELYYVDHQSLWLDIKIIFWTVKAVLTGKGAV